jgi:membrane fusion protein, heavy metal efflux system
LSVLSNLSAHFSSSAALGLRHRRGSSGRPQPPYADATGSVESIGSAVNFGTTASTGSADRHPEHDRHPVTGRLSVAVVAAACGIALASFIPAIPQMLHDGVALMGLGSRNAAAERLADEPQKAGAVESADELPASVRLSDNQIKIAGIELAPVQDGTLAHRIIVPATIVPDPDRVVRVSVRLSATVAELRKKLGDMVAKDEIIAVLESREVATAKSEYLAAQLNGELQRNLYDRDKVLWDRHIIAEQQVLRSRSAADQARVNLDIARQKLFALGVAEREITALPTEPETNLRRQNVRAPIAGRVVDRKVDLGAVVGRDNLETELFAIADLTRVWVELVISPSDLPIVKEGQTVSVAAHGLSYRAVGMIVFISPMIDRDTHSARVVAEIANPDGNWRPGSLVHATVAVEERTANLTVPASAVQTIGRARVVFVRTESGFEKRPVALGESDDRLFEVLAGVRAGEPIAVTNSFVIKAELLKEQAED